MAKRSSTESLGSVIRRWMAPFQAQPQYREALAWSAWESVLGHAVLSRTQKLYWRGDVLVVHLDSSAMRNELDLQKTKIADALQRAIGDAVEIKALELR